MYREPVDRVAFWIVIIGAIAWGPFYWDFNVLDVALEAVWDPLDNIVFVLIAVAGIYLAVRHLQYSRDRRTRTMSRGE